jgi:hypothetical protein
MRGQQDKNSGKNQKQTTERKGAKRAVGVTNQPEAEMQRQEKVVKSRPEGQTGFEKIKRRRAA